MKRNALLIVFLVLFLDQAVKIWIKTHMYLGQEYAIAGNWFIIHFTENNGMAFGMEFAGNYGKLLLSVFRIITISGIAWYLFDLVKKNAHPGYIAAIALIFSGATGNLIDSCFYGLMFNESYNEVASFMPEGGGYAGFLYGRVVDMLYFPLFDGTFPQWIPFFGGEEFMFFRPVFNIADSAITVGVSMILLFQKRFFEEQNVPQDPSSETNAVSSPEKPE